MSNNGTFEIESTPDNRTRQSTIMSDRDPLIKKESAFEGGIFRGLVQPCAAEFIATTLFVFVGTLSVNNGNPVSIAFAHGLAIAFLVAATANVSGGHLNPAVTLGIFLSGGIGPVKAVCYVLSQLLGGILGAALTKGVLPEAAYEAINGGSHLLPDSTTVGQGILCEVIITSILVTTVLMTALDNESKTPMAPIYIGLAVVAGILAAATVSGASMNPARSFGPAVVDSSLQTSQWDYHHIYWIGPVVGGLLAALWYKFLLAGPTKSLMQF